MPNLSVDQLAPKCGPAGLPLRDGAQPLPGEAHGRLPGEEAAGLIAMGAQEPLPLGDTQSCRSSDGASDKLPKGSRARLAGIGCDDSPSLLPAAGAVLPSVPGEDQGLPSAA